MTSGTLSSLNWRNPMTDQPEHYPISPSSCYRIERCPGSVKLSMGIESKSSEYADQGTEAHSVAETTLSLGLAKVDCDDLEMKVAVQIYVDFVYSIINKEPEEYGIEYKAPHAEIPNFGGTVDFYAIYTENGKRILHVVDYKHGAGKFVDHVRNRQMQSYAAIWLSNNFEKNVSVARMTIVQPRSFECDEPVRTYETNVGEIYAWENLLRSLIGSNFLRAGDHCNWCPAKLVCPEMKKQALRVAQSEFSPGLPEPEKIQDEISWLLELDRMGDTLKATIEDARRRIQELLMRGVPVPGFKLVEKVGNRKWSVSDEELEEIFEMIGVERSEYVESSFVSPAKADKLLGKKLVAKLTERPKLTVAVSEAESPGKPFTPGSEFTVIEDIQDIF